MGHYVKTTAFFPLKHFTKRLLIRICENKICVGLEPIEYFYSKKKQNL